MVSDSQNKPESSLSECSGLRQSIQPQRQLIGVPKPADLAAVVGLPTPFYDRDGITLYCGDCREILDAISFDIMISDPPYGISLANHDSTGQFRKARDWTIAGDGDLESAEWVIANCRQRGKAIVAFASPDKPYSGSWRNRLVWHKVGLGMGGDPATCWRRDWELIMVDGTGALNGGRDSAVLNYPIRPNQFVHPCQKPVELMRYLIRKIPGEVICDPFAGSGATLLAAKLEGRRAVGIEINEDCCRIAVNLLKQKVLNFAEAETCPA